MVRKSMDVVAWLRKQLEEADPNLLRTMVSAFVDVWGAKNRITPLSCVDTAQIRHYDPVNYVAALTPRLPARATQDRLRGDQLGQSSISTPAQVDLHEQVRSTLRVEVQQRIREQARARAQ
jgi:hypothetical protein